ncbi:MAG: SMP-30/gluconolactonase/LRE family protein [Sphingopyxis sp.]|nr:SMP-30/gluconolactonase/LRE family protein [Sphingopyxis sp.]
MAIIDTLTARPIAVVNARAELGECPRWHGGEQRLYWVDIAKRALLRWHPASGALETRIFDAPVACFAFRQNGGMVLGMKDGCALIDDWGGAARAHGDQPLAGRPHHRMNDGRTDGSGAFWVGSMNGAKDVADAALYRLDPAGALTQIEGGMMTCNGAAFAAALADDGVRFAHSDTPSHAVRVYDVAGAALVNRRILHQFEPGVGPGLGRPDGGSFDADGCYWVAMFDGWRVVRLSPAGDVIADIRLPVQRPTMISFGGDDRRTAFVTTARTGLDEAALTEQTLAGAIFAFRVDVPGVAEHPFMG